MNKFHSTSTSQYLVRNSHYVSKWSRFNQILNQHRYFDNISSEAFTFSHPKHPNPRKIWVGDELGNIEIGFRRIHIIILNLFVIKIFNSKYFRETGSIFTTKKGLNLSKDCDRMFAEVTHYYVRHKVILFAQSDRVYQFIIFHQITSLLHWCERKFG